MTKSSEQKKYINLALQGGGSHGAFTWGVLDRLLEEENLKFEGLSGTSAGAINAALVATGVANEGRDTARHNLDQFWHAVSALNTPQDNVFFSHFLSPMNGLLFSYLSQLFSPYEFNPLNHNPIKSILEKHVDFEFLRNTKKVKIYVSATNVETNRIKVFDNVDLCIEALLASTCLPTLHQAVQWRGKYFWDGGFMGNPILEPLIYNCESNDLLIVQVNPIEREGIPKTSRDILDRINEVTFNSSLMREIRGIVNIQKLSHGNWCDKENPYAKLRLHSVQDEEFMAGLGASSKFDITLDFLKSLKAKGRAAAEHWLKKNFNRIGVETTMDLSKWHIETPTTTCLEWGES